MGLWARCIQREPHGNQQIEREKKKKAPPRPNLFLVAAQVFAFLLSLDG